MRHDRDIAIARARRGTSAASQDAQLRRAIADYLQESLGQTLRDFRILKEKLEVLNADRGEPDQAALRREDLERLTEIEEMESTEVSGTVTDADFNALRQDVKAIHDALSAIAETLR